MLFNQRAAGAPKSPTAHRSSAAFDLPGMGAGLSHMERRPGLDAAPPGAALPGRHRLVRSRSRLLRVISRRSAAPGQTCGRGRRSRHRHPVGVAACLGQRGSAQSNLGGQRPRCGHQDRLPHRILDDRRPPSLPAPTVGFTHVPAGAHCWTGLTVCSEGALHLCLHRAGVGDSAPQRHALDLAAGCGVRERPGARRLVAGHARGPAGHRAAAPTHRHRLELCDT